MILDKPGNFLESKNVASNRYKIYHLIAMKQDLINKYIFLVY